ncbi:MAG: hypothetical protein J6V09_03180 [Clostridia bacterium]|nr:hypothetical protein [Clostridia bacterium]
MKKTVSYRDFGVVGDGITNDFFAIKAAHEYANQNGCSVIAHPEDTYLISDTRDAEGNVHYVEVKTDVDWRGASFIIDDTNFMHFDGTGVTAQDLFIVLPDTEPVTVDDEDVLAEILGSGFDRSTERVVIPGVDYPVMMTPYDSSNRVYRRRGFGSHVGGVTHEVVVLDKDGYVSDDTHFLFKYSALDSVKLTRLDEPHITLENATFTTRASHFDIVERDAEGNAIRSRNGYIQRGIEVMRSFTTVKNVKHYVTGEVTLAEQAKGMLGPTYNGFFGATGAHAVTFQDCILTAKRCFRKNNVPGAGRGTSGSYDYTVNDSNLVIFKNCHQSNFWITIDMETGEIKPATADTPGAQLSMTATAFGNINFKIYWGLGGANYTKNMQFIDSTLSRFDAHAGLMNGKIINSTVNTVSLVGGGDMVIENSTLMGLDHNKGDTLLGMRSDYGSPWDGRITLKNVKAYVNPEKPCRLAGHGYLNWYCGYQSCFPNIEVDSLTVYDFKTGEPLPRGHVIYLTGESMLLEPALHLPETKNSHPIFAKIDADGDGFVDGTDILYDGIPDSTGIIYEGSNENLNPVKPPEYVKICGNGAGFAFAVPKTAGCGVSDGGYYNAADNFGGFFGGTKFYYGDGEDDYYLGTDHTDTEIFKFI